MDALDHPIDWTALQQSVNSQTERFFSSSLPPAPPPASVSTLTLAAPPPTPSYLHRAPLAPATPHLSLTNPNQNTLEMLTSISSSQATIKSSLHLMASAHLDSASGIAQDAKENRGAIADLQGQLTDVARRVREVEGSFGLCRQRQGLAAETLEHLNSQTSKHQLWIGHADGLLAANEMKHKMAQQQVMQLGAQGQGFAGRQEMEARLGAMAGR